MKKILIVDDSPFMLKVTEDMLTRSGYDVSTAKDGQEACSEVQSNKFDMIITDMNMPVMDGLELTQKVRTFPGCRFLPVLMVSGEGDEEKKTQAKKLGVSTFLSKPLDENKLKSILHIVLSKRKSPRVRIKVEVFYGKNPMLSGYTMNMSTGGVYIETDSPLPAGESISLKLFLSENNAPLECSGKVAWVNPASKPIVDDHPPGMGVEFFSGVDEAEIRSFLSSFPGR